jgi:RNA polymerase sigma-70 factor, ECF subfamily
MDADEVLMQAVAAGDGRALAELCRRYERPLLRLLGRQTGGRDVEDLYQDTWLRVVRAADRYDPSRRFSTWLFQIALNLARDWRRRPPPEPIDTAALGAGGDVTTAATEATLDVARLLDALPEPQRDAVVLRYCQDLDEAEVADVLGCPRGTVKSRLHHAMARLVELARGAPGAAAPALPDRRRDLR